ncbi:maleylacetate reductase [Devosia sp. XJ19-1]|uniref:Maleylacetate reductase n=1 Tax=Devosia ureilytica TaxID=2952754 RepID=A0A9Q4FQB5_9HYPH|nr:maleylacetate reductase [Devosia ureilytica]MCP8882328.1 maleylacetate reductase [Devosia ureilytica]MCP8885786.1 maleylacetate reductase [Devosia ureilytica]
MDSFTLQTYAQRILFDVDHLSALPDLMDDFGAHKVGIVTTRSHATSAASVSEALGSRHAATFAGAKVHTPVEVTRQALGQLAGSDAIISIGGGSTIGLGKALSLPTGARHIAIPTTYAGSEMTPILGQTDKGRKIVGRDDRVVPDAVIYDVGLTLSLPRDVSMASGFNALAHAVEALYAPDRYPEADATATASIANLVQALPAIARDPLDLQARRQAQYGAYLAGRVLAGRTMGLHHKLAHVLGGLFDLPHAPLHAVLLPHVVKFNEPVAMEALAPAAELLGRNTSSVGLACLADALGLPTTLSEIGMPRDGIHEAARLVVESRGANPRPYSEAEIVALLEEALGD